MFKRTTFFARWALPILVIVFFLVPFALRGARFAVEGMKNDVKDWLPADYTETTELDWFRKNFISEQFVIVTWDGCTGDANDERFKLFVAKLTPELPPSLQDTTTDQPVEGTRESIGLEPSPTDIAQSADVGIPATPLPPGAIPSAELPSGAIPDAALPPDALPPAAIPNPQPDASAVPPAMEVAEDGEPNSGNETTITNPTRMLARPDFIGDTFGLHTNGNYHQNWGRLDEKWLRGAVYHKDSAGKTEVAEKKWFFITPEGDLYVWNAVDSPFATAWRAFWHSRSEDKVVGELVHSFGPVDGPWYYANPKRLRAQLFKSVTTGPDVRDNLIREGGVLADDPEEAARRLAGSLFGPDGKQTCILVTLTDSARRDLHQLVGRGLLGKPRGRLFEIADECNIGENDLRMGGPPIDNVAIDEEGSITLVRLIGMCAVIGIGLSFLCFRSISVTFIVFFVGGMSAVICLALVYWTGSSVDAITMSMPALVYVLGLSGAAHIVNYYNEAVTESGHAGAPETAVRHGWKPALLCNITTAIGLLSLYSSEIVPIRKFGIYSALGVLATLIILFTYLPAALQIWPQKRKEKNSDGEWLNNYLSGFWQALGNFCIRRHWFVSTACALFIVITGYGVVHIKTSVNLLKMFSADAKIIKDYNWLEDNLGQLVPMEVVLAVQPQVQLPSARQREQQNETNPEEQFQLSFLERMELANQVQQVIQSEFGSQGRNVVGQAMSAATFAPRLPPAKGDTSTFARRGATGRLLEAHRKDFLHSDYLRIDSDQESKLYNSELWRVSLRLGATKGVDYGEFVKDLKCAVEPVLTAHECRESVLRKVMELRNGQRPAGASVLLLGLPADVLTPGAGFVTASGESAPTGTPPLEGAASHQNIDQTKIFVQSLINLLNVSRLRVRTQASDSETTPQQLAKLIAEADCVVLVGNQSGLDETELNQQAKLVDGRAHIFDPFAPQLKSTLEDPKEISAIYTGVVPIVYKAQRALLESLIESTFWSFITITPLMMLIARSFSGGAVAMLPNVLPVLVVFGGMGWLGVDVDVGSMMTASIALGVAVDDTIHYLNWYREELDRVGDRKLAILGAYRHCATPTFQSAVISGLGLSVFALSTFTPTQRFGYLMLTILWAGVLAELVFFPAILAGPLGLVFKPRKRKAGSSPSGHDDHASDSAKEASGPVEVTKTPNESTAEVHKVHSADEPAPAVVIPPATRPSVIPTSSSPASSGAVPAPNSGRSKAAVMRILRQDTPHKTGQDDK